MRCIVLVAILAAISASASSAAPVPTGTFLFGDEFNSGCSTTSFSMLPTTRTQQKMLVDYIDVYALS